ncbi:LytR/AlgR family response regulator transcription factor [Arcticibacter sp.]|uniref:LytR/AlgR family response regulator transcription factor n=1 Tax=Arcticibacter sp. TaxID=1872630 RepID=UPI00388E69BC
MTVLIIEDEELAANTLATMLGLINPALKVLAILGTVESAVNWLQQQRPDLIFMDIHLGDGESFAIFEQVPINSPVIYTTAYDQYTLKAFKKQGIDYLLKPFDEEDVRAALTKLEGLRPKQETLRHPGTRMNPLPAGFRNRFMVKVGRLIKTVPTDEVAYFMADDKYLFLITHDEKKYIIEDTISNLEPQLNGKDFYRINRKFIIHISAIKEMYKLSRNRIRIILSPKPEDVEVVVSEERSESFKDWLNQ